MYLARDPQQDRLVAIKVPRSDKLKSPRQIEEFLREARTAATLDHPNIVPVFDFDRLPDGGCFVVMKYIEGRSLEKAMETERFTFEWIAELCAQIADALDYAHRQKFVHRDVKPANILLDEQGLAYVADFGLAIHEETQHRHKDERAGTWVYMSPEQVRGESHHLDARTDVWSLGVILYELLTRQKPFPGKTPAVLEDEIQFREPKPPRSIDRQVPEELERVCLQCLVKSVAARCPSAAVMADELRRPYRLPKPLEEAPKPASTRSYLLYWASGAAVLGLAAILLSIGIWMNTSRVREPGRWYSLLEQKPKALVISEIAADTNWRFDAKVPEIVISSGHPVAIGVGQTDSQNFLIEARIAKTNWQGTAGIFWGMHEGETSDGSPSVRYQTLVIQSHLENGRVTYRLERKFMESWIPGAATATGRETYLVEEVESPDSSEILLKITMIEGKVMEISWNGKARPGVCDSPGIRSPNPLISAGKLGLYNENGTSIFRDVRLQILPTAKRPDNKK